MSSLSAVDLGRKLAPRPYEKQIAAEQLRLRALHFEMYERKVPALAVFEGWDASGKGGAIKRVTETLEPRGYTVASFSAPRGEEKTHHYLWRFWRVLPRAGHLLNLEEPARFNGIVFSFLAAVEHGRWGEWRGRAGESRA